MSDARRSFYITCAIDYVNSRPHLGTAYEKIAADAIARYHRLAGDDVTFLMGNDEHSLNVEKAATEKGLDPLVYTDQMAETFESVWKNLEISNDIFIRTTEPRHHKSVQELFRRIHENGDIFKGTYDGFYCVSCEEFKQEKDLLEGNLCPVHKKPADFIQEENWFFKLSEYQQPLLDLYERQPDFLIPAARRNEIVNVIKDGLRDLSISRPGSGWGVPFPIDPTQRVYVWFDALINYITGAGFAADEEQFNRVWPADLHVIGKDITRFHCIIWPAMLMAAGVTLPKQILGHGWVTMKGEKLSKSLGNIIDPLDVTAKFGPDPLRFYLLKEVPLDRDGDFTWELFIERYNTELANDVGNLVSRSVTMAVKYFEGDVPAVCDPESKGPDAELRDGVERAVSEYRKAFESLAVDQAIAAASGLIRRADQYIQETEPWALAKDESQRDRLATVLNVLMESVRIAAVLMTPIIPGSCARIRERLNCAGDESTLSLKQAEWNPLGNRPQAPLTKPSPLFPRIDSTGS